MVPMRVERVLEVVTLGGEKSHVVVLVDEEGKTALPITIGSSEAEAIAIGMSGARPSRPLTHDLLLHVVEELGGRIEQVLVHDIRGETFIGQVDVATSHGVLEVDCRPSDGIAIAVRAGCPILADEEVLAKAGVDPDRFRGGEESSPPTWD
ncbi:MAG: bifunctional nuclease family protein [Bacillota bacterium]|nr:bifunctional nuclease family protein [Bacillota bacterium]